MEPPEPERGPRLLLRSRAAWALLSAALLAALAGLAARLLLPAPPPPPPPTPQSGARLVLDGPGKIMKPGKLEWYADSRMDGVYLGPGFEYSPVSHMLKIKDPGLYFIYAQLSAVHIFKSSSKKKGNATLTIHRKSAHSSAPVLTLPLRLSSRSNKSLAAFTAVSPCQLAEGDLLFVTLAVSGSAVEGLHKPTQWYFGDGTAFGLSLISGNCNTEATGISSCSPATREVEWILKELGKFFQSHA